MQRQAVVVDDAREPLFVAVPVCGCTELEYVSGGAGRVQDHHLERPYGRL